SPPLRPRAARESWPARYRLHASRSNTEAVWTTLTGSRLKGVSAARVGNNGKTVAWPLRVVFRISNIQVGYEDLGRGGGSRRGRSKDHVRERENAIARFWSCRPLSTTIPERTECEQRSNSGTWTIVRPRRAIGSLKLTNQMMTTSRSTR